MRINVYQFNIFVQTSGDGELQAITEVAGEVYVSFKPEELSVRIVKPPHGTQQKVYVYAIDEDTITPLTENDFALQLLNEVAGFFSFAVYESSQPAGAPLMEADTLKILPQHLTATSTGEYKKAGDYSVKLWRQSATRFVLTVTDAGRRRDYDIRDGQLEFPPSQKQAIVTALNFLGIQYDTSLSEVAVNFTRFSELPVLVTVQESDGTEVLQPGDVIEVNKPLRYIVVYKGGDRGADDPPFFYYAKDKLRPRNYPEDEPMLQEVAALLGLMEA